MCDWALFVSCKKLCLFLLVICSQLSFSRILVLCADGGTSSSQPVSSYASLISPLSQTLLPFSFVALQWPSHLPPLTLFYCSFLFFFLIFFFLFCCISLGCSTLPSSSMCLWLFANCRTSTGVGQHVFLQLLCESRRDVLGIEAAVCLPLCMHELSRA